MFEVLTYITATLLSPKKHLDARLEGDLETKATALHFGLEHSLEHKR